MDGFRADVKVYCALNVSVDCIFVGMQLGFEEWTETKTSVSSQIIYTGLSGLM